MEQQQQRQQPTQQMLMQTLMMQTNERKRKRDDCAVGIRVAVDVGVRGCAHDSLGGHYDPPNASMGTAQVANKNLPSLSNNVNAPGILGGKLKDHIDFVEPMLVRKPRYSMQHFQQQQQQCHKMQRMQAIQMMQLEDHQNADKGTEPLRPTIYVGYPSINCNAPVVARPKPSPSRQQQKLTLESPIMSKPCHTFHLFFRLEKNMILQSQSLVPLSLSTIGPFALCPGEKIETDPRTIPSKYHHIYMPKKWYLEDTPDFVWVQLRRREVPQEYLKDKIAREWAALDSKSKGYFMNVSKFLLNRFYQYWNNNKNNGNNNNSNSNGTNNCSRNNNNHNNKTNNNIINNKTSSNIIINNKTNDNDIIIDIDIDIDNTTTNININNGEHCAANKIQKRQRGQEQLTTRQVNHEQRCINDQNLLSTDDSQNNSGERKGDGVLQRPPNSSHREPSSSPNKPCDAYHLFYCLEKNHILQTFRPTGSDDSTAIIITVQTWEEVEEVQKLQRPLKYRELVLPRYWYLKNTPDLVWVENRSKFIPGLDNRIMDMWTKLDNATKSSFIQVSDMITKKYSDWKKELSKSKSELSIPVDKTNQKIMSEQLSHSSGVGGKDEGENARTIDVGSVSPASTDAITTSYRSHDSTTQALLLLRTGVVAPPRQLPPSSKLMHLNHNQDHIHNFKGMSAPESTVAAVETGAVTPTQTHADTGVARLEPQQSKFARLRSTREGESLKKSKRDCTAITSHTQSTSSDDQEIEHELNRLRNLTRMQIQQLREREVQLETTELENEMDKLRSTVSVQSRCLRGRETSAQELLRAAQSKVGNENVMEQPAPQCVAELHDGGSARNEVQPNKDVQLDPITESKKSPLREGKTSMQEFMRTVESRLGNEKVVEQTASQHADELCNGGFVGGDAQESDVAHLELNSISQSFPPQDGESLQKLTIVAESGLADENDLEQTESHHVDVVCESQPNCEASNRLDTLTATKESSPITSAFVETSFVWTDEEDWALLELYKMYGENWALISCLLTGRTLEEVSSRFQLISEKEQTKGGTTSFNAATQRSAAESGNEDPGLKLPSCKSFPSPVLPFHLIGQHMPPPPCTQYDSDSSGQYADAEEDTFGSEIIQS